MFAFDAVHGQTLMFGGSVNGSTSTELWAWDGTNWARLGGVTPPAPTKGPEPSGPPTCPPLATAKPGTVPPAPTPAPTVLPSPTGPAIEVPPTAPGAAVAQPSNGGTGMPDAAPAEKGVPCPVAEPNGPTEPDSGVVTTDAPVTP